MKLAETTICVVGPKKRQNSLMVSFLERETGAVCLAGDEDFQIPKRTKKNRSQPRLIFWDCQDSGNKEKCLSDFDTKLNNRYPLDLVVFNNVRSELGIEEEAIYKGVRGFFYESDPLEQLPKCLHAVLKGELWISRRMMSEYVLDRSRRFLQYSKKANSPLSEREIEILSLASLGASNKEIAGRLNISPHTIKSHLYNIYKKLNVPNRLQAILWAGQNF